MNINQIIQVNVNSSSASAQLEDLSLPLVIGDHSAFPLSFTDSIRVKSYTSLAGMIADGFQTTTALYKTCQAVFANGVSKILVGKMTVADAGSYVAALTAITTVNNSFYAILIDSQLASDILAVALHVEALENIFLACSSDVAILDNTITNDIASQLKANSCHRTQIFYSSSSRLDGAVCGSVLSTSVGRDRVAYLSNLSNINSDILSSSQISTLQAKYCSFYSAVAGIALVISNTSNISTQVSSIRDIDWFKNQIQISILNYLAKNKIPYSDAGIAIVENIIIQVIVQAMNYGVLSFATQAEIAKQLGLNENQVQGYISAIGCSLVMPNLSTISQSDITQGILNGIYITALYSGMILKININAQI